MRLRYWIKQGFSTLGVVLLAWLLYSAMMLLQLSAPSWESVGGTVPIYLLVFGGMMQLAMVLGVYKLNLPLCLSFGSTRREASVGIQLFRLIPVVGLTAVLTVLTALLGDTSPLSAADAVPSGLGISLAAAALGSLMGMVYLRFGKLAVILTVVVMLLCGGTAGFLAVVGVNNEWLNRSIAAIGLQWIALVIGAVLYLVSLIPEHRVIRKYQVKL